MKQAQPPQNTRCALAAVDTLMRQGDTRWGGWVPSRREHALAVPWSEELLSQFSLRMASHGMSISRTHMLGNPGYALQQLAHARALGDATLDLLVGQLFRCYEAHQSGVHTPSH
jgi:hypothetical protein